MALESRGQASPHARIPCRAAQGTTVEVHEEFVHSYLYYHGKQFVSALQISLSTENPVSEGTTGCPPRAARPGLRQYGVLLGGQNSMSQLQTPTTEHENATPRTPAPLLEPAAPGPGIGSVNKCHASPTTGFGDLTPDRLPRISPQCWRRSSPHPAMAVAPCLPRLNSFSASTIAQGHAFYLLDHANSRPRRRGLVSPSGMAGGSGRCYPAPPVKPSVL